MKMHPDFNRLLELWMKDVFAGNYAKPSQLVIRPVTWYHAQTLLRIEVEAHVSGAETQCLRLVFPRVLVFK